LPFLHFFELASSLDPWVLVFPFSLPDDTLCFLNVVIDVPLNFVAHSLNLPSNLLLGDSCLQLALDLFLS
jgi:hypothetical protein